MTKRAKAEELKIFLDDRFGNVPYFLNHSDDWQFLIAVILSAQATDNSVNAVTPLLFEKYPSLDDLSRADEKEVIEIIKPVGLSKAKAGYIKKTAGILMNELNGLIPKDRKKLMTLPGVGYKTSGVVLGELYGFPYLPVDTHVERVSKWLGLVDNDMKSKAIEEELERLFKGYDLINTHKQLILLGRTILKAKNPKWELLPFAWIKKTNF